jgi:sec-independent protein translocase protein TatA
MLANFGPGHWLVLAVVMVLMFAGNKLPGAARALRTSLRIFKSELHELHTEDKADKPAFSPTPVQVGRINTPADQAADQTNTDA